VTRFSTIDCARRGCSIERVTLASLEMNIFRSLFGKKKPPPAPPTSLAMREFLFGDVPLDQWPPPGGSGDAFPWSAFVAARAHLAAGRIPLAIAAWRGVLAEPHLESRHYAQAWHFLRQHGEQPPAETKKGIVDAKNLFGVVVEAGMPNGLDVVAAYADRTARVFHHSGRGFVFEGREKRVDILVTAFLEAGQISAACVEPWGGQRPPAPVDGEARISYLTTRGLHLEGGPWQLLPQGSLSLIITEIALRIMALLLTGKDPGPRPSRLPRQPQ
jgi:hypothetical protein